MVPFRPFWATLERVQGTKKSPKSKKMIAAFFGTPCTFACFVTFGVQTLFLVPSRHKTPQKRIFAHYQRSFLLCYGPVWFLSPLHSPSPVHTRVQSLWGRGDHKVLSHKSPINLDCHSVLCLDVFHLPRFRRFLLAELLCF